MSYWCFWVTKLAFMSYFLTYSPLQPIRESAYVLPDTLGVWDSPAEIRMQIATLKSGDRVYALARFRTWAHVQLINGQDGWVDKDGLMTAGTYAADEHLLGEMSNLPAQAAGHAADSVNVHLEPSRKAAVAAQLKPQQPLDIFGRRMVQRPTEGNTTDVPASTPVEAWYLVRSGPRAGWILGRLVELDVPKNISAYTQDVNLVAWLVLNTIDDSGRQVPQYIVADRAGTETYDYTHIRVLTWWKRKQTYAIAYREGDLQGYFPILVTHEGTLPGFRLRLVDSSGAKYQKVYALFDTITRALGPVAGWQSGAMPAPPEPKRAPKRRARHAKARR